MTALYKAVGQGGSGLSCTQLMRLAFKKIDELRTFKVPWIWIAKRLFWVREKGVEYPMPTSNTVDELDCSELPISSVRAAYLRLKSETPVEEQKPSKCAASAVSEESSSKIQSGKAPEEADDNQRFFDTLNVLKASSP